MDNRKRIKELIDRLGRLSAAEEWADEINPAQRAALMFIARANRFSRSPSHVADFMASTRGTTSQTLKALSRKGLVKEFQSRTDKRSNSYSITDAGEELLRKPGVVESAISFLDDDQALLLRESLEVLTHTALAERGFKAFGICNTCRYFAPSTRGGHCNLLNEKLALAETEQICHEHAQVV